MEFLFFSSSMLKGHFSVIQAKNERNGIFFFFNVICDFIQFRTQNIFHSKNCVSSMSRVEFLFGVQESTGTHQFVIRSNIIKAWKLWNCLWFMMQLFSYQFSTPTLNEWQPLDLNAVKNISGLEYV